MTIPAKTAPSWTVASALTFLQMLEFNHAQELGCHFGLAGGVMYRGYSDKDLDILVYPHTTAKPYDVADILSVFKTYGYIQDKWLWLDANAARRAIHYKQGESRGDTKRVAVLSNLITNQRIDLFFL